MEAEFWKLNGAYKYIDKIICCSEFLKTKMDTNPLFREKTIALHNFVERVEPKVVEKKELVLLFLDASRRKKVQHASGNLQFAAGHPVCVCRFWSAGRQS